MELISAYEKFTSQLNTEVFLCPTDYPYLYRDIENTNIFIGNQSHWRRINQTLCTFLTSKKMIDKYHEKITQMCKFEHFPFEKPLHEIYKTNPCLSPINSLSYHISRGQPATTEDWIKLWNNNQIKFES